MHNPKHEAQMTEDAGLTGISEHAPSTVNPQHLPTPAQGPVVKPTPAKQDKLDLERSAGEGMTAPPSNP